MRADCRSAPPSSAVTPAWAAPRHTRLSVLTSRLAQTYHSANCSSEVGVGLSTPARVGPTALSGPRAALNRRDSQACCAKMARRWGARLPAQRGQQVVSTSRGSLDEVRTLRSSGLTILVPVIL